MARGPYMRVRVAAVILAFVGVILAAVPARAQYAESPADSLARNMKLLGSSPRNFDALVAAGRAALALGDTQAAAGFFGRAEEVWPASPLPQAGMGAALAHEGDGRAALQYFARAAQRGATQSMIGAERGLAYDLIGQHALAQADYRAALAGRDGDEARRRLALSLAITGNKAEALALLGPLMARGDAAGARCRAFVLALSGDVAGARAAIEARMPGASAQMAYFFSKLPALRSDQKAAAVNLGIFPSDGTRAASAAPSEDRIGAIQQWLSQTSPSAPPPPAAQAPATRTAAAALPSRPDMANPATQSRAAMARERIWLQLASGPNADALPEQFRRIRSRSRDLFDGISPYVAQDGARARLLIGPFRSEKDAGIFAEDLEAVRISAFQWTSKPGQDVRKLPGE
ncbi:MAG TPA: hypothetical protein VFK58_03170 [Sphingomicrobium sp.]|nr:hypothetical protein [Sphingomicrobium sp.]